MYQSLTVRRFRGIEDLTLSPLKRISLITGLNGCGKTTVLEAMFLLVGHHNPQIPFRVQEWRGGPLGFADESVSWLFPSRNIESHIEVAAQRDDNRRLSLSIDALSPEKINDLEADSKTLALDKFLASDAAQLRGITIELKKDDAVVSESRALLAGEKMVLTLGSAQLGSAVFFGSGFAVPTENTSRFSDIRRQGRVGELVEALNIVQPQVRGLEILTFGPDQASICADIKGTLLPVSLLGGGASRLLSILLAVVTAESGIVLIDEFENGFHHSTLDDIWNAIDTASKGANVQVMATTHSLECIDAAHRHFEKSGYDFVLHRLDVTDGRTKDVAYREEILEAAISSGIEVR